MKPINKFFTMAMLLAAGLSFTSCSNDGDDNGGGGKSGEKATIIGEWFQDASVGDVKLLSTVKFNEGGTSDYWLMYINTPTSLYYNYSGSYSLNGKSLEEKYVSPISGDNTTDRGEITLLDNYTLTISNTATNSVGTFNRIVDNYQMTVGNSKAFGYSTADFKAESFKSSDESVVRINASGNIEAVKRGTAYISAIATVGTVVVRVTVNDPNNYIDDFMSFMGGPIDNVTKVYGNNYYEVSETLVERTYALGDEFVERVVFSYFGGIVMVANVTLREGVDSDAIIASFEKKYIRIDDSKYVPKFSTFVDDQEYHIYYFINDGMIVYTPYVETPKPDYNFSSENFEQFDNLIMMGTANVAANAFGITITEENMEDGWFDINNVDNEVFRQASVMFNEDPDDEDFMKITSIMLFTKSGIKQADIEQWYADHYTATGDEKNPYQSSTSPTYYISFKEGSSTTVYYKFRKNK